MDRNVDKRKYDLDDESIAVKAVMRAVDINNHSYFAKPIYAIQDRFTMPIPDEIDELGLKLIINKILPEKGKLEFELHEKSTNFREFIIMKAIRFPYINILWTGCILMVLGTVLAIRHRVKAL